LDSRPEQIKRVADESLKRLRVEAIDLFYSTVRILTSPSRTWRRRERVDSGSKVKHFGLSESNPIKSAAPMPFNPVTALQSEYSIWWTAIEEEILPTCEELGIGLVPYSPLGGDT
jgi:aryl-alcohol dehydrogenase-like predicted oxidoreductase